MRYTALMATGLSRQRKGGRESENSVCFQVTSLQPWASFKFNITERSNCQEAAGLHLSQCILKIDFQSLKMCLSKVICHGKPLSTSVYPLYCGYSFSCRMIQALISTCESRCTKYAFGYTELINIYCTIHKFLYHIFDLNMKQNDSWANTALLVSLFWTPADKKKKGFQLVWWSETWMYWADASAPIVGVSRHIVVSSILSQLRALMPHFDGTCVMENELVREIRRGKVAKWAHPRQPARRTQLLWTSEVTMLSRSYCCRSKALICSLRFIHGVKWYVYW